MKSNKELQIKKRMADAKMQKASIPMRKALREELLQIKGFGEYDEKVNKQLSDLYIGIENLNEKINILIDENIAGNDKVVANLEQTKTNDKLIELNNSIISLQSELLTKSLNVKDIDKLEKALQQSNKAINAINIPKDMAIKNFPDWLASEKGIEQINKNLANIAEQLEQIESNKPGQKPEDFVPFRRVVADGKRLRFDDSVGGGARGGGGGVNSAAIVEELQVINSLTPNEYDYIAVTYPTDESEVYAYKSGGSGGTTVQTVTVTYQDATKENIISVART